MRRVQMWRPWRVCVPLSNNGPARSIFSVLMAGQAVAVALEVGGHRRVGLLAVGVDAAADPAGFAEAVLREILHDALAAPAAVVEEDRLDLALDGRIERALDGLVRPGLPLDVGQMAEAGQEA